MSSQTQPPRGGRPVARVALGFALVAFVLQSTISLSLERVSSTVVVIGEPGLSGAVFVSFLFLAGVYLSTSGLFRGIEHAVVRARTREQTADRAGRD